MNRRRIVLLLGIQSLPVFALAGTAQAQEIVRARQNIEYRLIDPPQPVETGARIEVIDFFWYGCPHCNELQPALEDWLKRKPPDVALRRIPALLRDSWAPHARIFYTLELLKEVERLHLKVYHSYHVEELHMAKPDVMEQWAIKNGIDRRKWVDAYFSPEVDGSLARAKRATQVYTVEGTPSLAVDGRYLTSGKLAGSVKSMIPVLEDMIQLVRQRRAAK
jgi:protein dithiol oxidoreductase (disulfide-forming)